MIQKSVNAPHEDKYLDKDIRVHTANLNVTGVDELITEMKHMNLIVNNLKTIKLIKPIKWA